MIAQHLSVRIFETSIGSFLALKSRSILDFMIVGRLLHLTTVLCLPLIYFFYKMAINAYLSGDSLMFLIYGYATIHLSTVPVFAELDARSRYQNFKMVKDLLYQYGFRGRFINSLQYSKCQREAAVQAGRKTGYKKEVVMYFRKCNRRWYHFFPSFLLANPAYIFSKQFLVSTFFVKYYKPKYIVV